MPRVAIVVVTYNSERYLPELFESLSRMRTDGLDVETVFVDNDSTDSTRALLAQQQGIRVVHNANTGYAGGNNLAMREALAQGRDYVFLLNPDTVVDPGFLVEAVRAAEADPRAGAVQSLLLLWPEKDKVNSWGNALHFLGLGYALGYRRPAEEGKARGIREIAYPSGAAVLLRASALREVGLFDEWYFMYHEDLDLGWRLRLAGWKNLVAPASIVWHKYEFSRSIKKYFFMERNRYAVLFKNCRVWTLIVLAPWLILSEAALFLISCVRGWWREKLRVYAALCSGTFWKNIVRGRKEVAKFRRVSDREIFRPYTAVIEFQDVDSWFTLRVANPLMRVLWSVLYHCII